MTTTITGFAFPFRIDPTAGGVAFESGDDKLRSNIAQILLTNAGERVMNRAYGGGLRQIVQDPADGALLAVVQHQIGKSVGREEPRVDLQAVTVSPSGDGATLLVSVTYVVRRTQAVETLSVPIAVSGL